MDYIRPSPFCVAVKGLCTKTDFKFPEGHVILKASRSTSYVKPTQLPPNIRAVNLEPIFLQSMGAISVVSRILSLRHVLVYFRQLFAIIVRKFCTKDVGHLW